MELVEQLFEENYLKIISQPDVLILSSGEKLHCRKVKFVLQKHIPNKFKDPGGYAHQLLLIFLLIL